MTLTNVADQRDVYTFHTGAKWTSALQWRVRAVRMLYGQIANKLPSVSYGRGAPRTPPSTCRWRGRPSRAARGRVGHGHGRVGAEAAHRPTPGFVFTGN